MKVNELGKGEKSIEDLTNLLFKEKSARVKLGPNEKNAAKKAKQQLPIWLKEQLSKSFNFSHGKISITSTGSDIFVCEVVESRLPTPTNPFKKTALA